MRRFNRQCLLVLSVCVLGLLGYSWIAFSLSTVQLYDDSSTQQNLTPKFAYAFIVSGCTHTSCYGYILNAIAAKEVLRQVGSKADVLFMVRMAKHNEKGGENFELPTQHKDWLKQSNIQLRYLPSVRKENFGIATLEKFRTLELIEYDRVIFLDADILPLCNLDYLFDLSMQGTLSEYVALQGGVAPMTASTFLVKPRKGEFERILNLVHQQRALNRTALDPLTGWGHIISEHDPWISFTRKGHKWDFKAATSDQGLLYHWLKYMYGNFTFLQLRSIEEWRDVTSQVSYWANRTAVYDIENGTRHIAMTASRENDLPSCGGRLYGRPWWGKYPPFGDLYHFAGPKKPWNTAISYDAVNQDTAQDNWWYWLRQANETQGLRLPSIIKVPKGNPLGLKDTGDHVLDPEAELPMPIL